MSYSKDSPFVDIIQGLDTIKNGVKLPDMDVHITYKTATLIQEAQTAINSKFIAIIPYCMECKVPLDWVRGSDTLFQCPECLGIWRKSETWNAEMSKQHNKDKDKKVK